MAAYRNMPADFLYTGISSGPNARKRVLENFTFYVNKKHLKNVGPIRHCEPPHAHSPGVASGTVARRLRVYVHDNDNDNA